MSPRPLLFTGAGRSGTTWISRALCAAGIPCTHEENFSPEVTRLTGWMAESSSLAAPHVRYLPRDVWVVRLVRDPRNVVGSWLQNGGVQPLRSAWHDYLCRHVPELPLIENEVWRCGWAWTRWNRMFTPHEVACVERVTTHDVGRWARLVDPDTETPTDLPEPAHVTPTPPEPVTWEQLQPVPYLIDMARYYGYEVN